MRLNENQKVTLTLGQLKRLVKESEFTDRLDSAQYDGDEIQLENHSVTRAQIREAEKVLVDNGIDEDEVDTVLQAVGYALLDTELYPDLDDDSITEDKESEAWGLDGKSRPGWEYGGLR